MSHVASLPEVVVFAGALQAGHQDDRWRLRGELEARGVLAEDGDQLVANNLDDLLGRRKRGHHFLADGLVANVVDQLLDDFKVDVGFEQRKADFAERLGDIFFSDGALSAQVLEGALQAFGEIFKHADYSLAVLRLATWFVILSEAKDLRLLFRMLSRQTEASPGVQSASSCSGPSLRSG